MADIQDMPTARHHTLKPSGRLSVSRDLWLGLLLVAAVFAAYHDLAHQDFVNLDDHVYVTANPHVKDGLSLDSVVWAFTTFKAEFWHPLTWLSLMLDAQVYGLNPGGFKFTNLLLHLLATLFLFAALRRMTGNSWASGLAALVFAVHPLHVESVAWVAERKEVLSGALGCMTLWLYAHYAGRPSAARLCLLGLAFACGLMAKSMVITLPAVMLLLDVWPLKRWDPTRRIRPPARLLWEKLPLFGLALLFAVTTLLAQSASFGLATLEEAPMTLRLQNALVSYVRHLWHFLWPTNLALWYPYPKSVPFWQWGGALGLLTAMTAGCLSIYRRAPYVLIGWLWYLGMLFPVIGLIKFGGVAMADRFMNLPMAGLSIALAWSVDEGLARLKANRARALRIVVTLLVAAVLVPLTVQQSRHWRNSLGLYRHAVRVNPDSHMAHYTYGWALGKAGDYKGMLEHLRRAVAIAPGNAYMHYHLARGYLLLKHPAGARRHLETALQLHPRYEEAREALQGLEDND